MLPARWIRVRVRVSVRVLFRQTLDEWMGPKVHFFLKKFPLQIIRLFENNSIQTCTKPK